MTCDFAPFIKGRVRRGSLYFIFTFLYFLSTPFVLFLSSFPLNSRRHVPPPPPRPSGSTPMNLTYHSRQMTCTRPVPRPRFEQNYDLLGCGTRDIQNVGYNRIGTKVNGFYFFSKTISILILVRNTLLHINKLISDKGYLDSPWQCQTVVTSN